MRRVTRPKRLWNTDLNSHLGSFSLFWDIKWPNWLIIIMADDENNLNISINCKLANKAIMISLFIFSKLIKWRIFLMHFFSFFFSFSLQRIKPLLSVHDTLLGYTCRNTHFSFMFSFLINIADEIHMWCLLSSVLFPLRRNWTSFTAIL